MPGPRARRKGGTSLVADDPKPDDAFGYAPELNHILETVRQTYLDALPIAAAIVTVDEARASQGLSSIGGTEGGLTVAEYQAKNAAVIAAAANATAGTPATPQEGAPLV